MAAGALAALVGLEAPLGQFFGTALAATDPNCSSSVVLSVYQLLFDLLRQSHEINNDSYLTHVFSIRDGGTLISNLYWYNCQYSVLADQLICSAVLVLLP